MSPSRAYLLLRGSSSALGQFAVVVHGGGSASRGLSVLPSFRVQHPPGTFSRSFILNANEAAVQGQVVSDGVLKRKEKKKKNKSQII